MGSTGRISALAPEASTIEAVPQLRRLSPEWIAAMKVVAAVLPFRVDRYVLDHLIDWDKVPDDPLFLLTFPQEGMLSSDQFARVASAFARRDERTLAAAVRDVRRELQPHPGMQIELNVPWLDGRRLDGLQHKYSNTLLVFPDRGQTCHTYCTYCFRWAQFVDDGDLHMPASSAASMLLYLEHHPEITDVLLTGGDPLVMSARRLSEYIVPLLEDRFEHVQSIRIGTRALSFSPQRFVTDRDADELLRLFETVAASGKNLAVMAHYDHWRELVPPLAQSAVQRVRGTGAVIRSQGPLLRGVNDAPETLARLWTSQIRAGIVPYYLFVARDTGARRFFEIPLARCVEIYRTAVQSVSGLARTARGPVMSTEHGKVLIHGVSEVAATRAFVCSFLQARCDEWVGRPFFARFDPSVTWFSQLRDVDNDAFFFERDLRNCPKLSQRDVCGGK